MKLTRKVFVQVMNKTIGKTEGMDSGGYTCIHLDNVLGAVLKTDAYSMGEYSPLAHAYAQFLDLSNANETIQSRMEIYLDPSDTRYEHLRLLKTVRVSALVLFKEYMLETKQFKNVKIV